MPDQQPLLGADGRDPDQVAASQRGYSDAEIQIGASYDRHLLTLASGALAISIGFVDRISTTPSCTFMLFSAWALFAACMAACLVAILMSQASINRFAEIDRRNFEQGPRSPNIGNPFIRWVGIFNWTGFVTFIFAITLMVAFAVQNQKGNLMSNETLMSPPAEIKKSAGGQRPVVVPQAPPKQETPAGAPAGSAKTPPSK